MGQAFDIAIPLHGLGTISPSSLSAEALGYFHSVRFADGKANLKGALFDGRSNDSSQFWFGQKTPQTRFPWKSQPVQRFNSKEVEL